MKEVKAAREQQVQLLDRIEAQIAFYDDNLRYEEGDETTEKKTVKLQRDMLYQEMWEISPSKVARKYDIPYDKLKAACVKENIPLPTQSYWGNLQAGKPVQKTPLPVSTNNEVIIEFSYRKKSSGLSLILDDAAKTIESDTALSSESDSNLIMKGIQSEKTALFGQKNVDKTESNKAVLDNAASLSFLTEDERNELIETAIELRVDPDCKKIHPVLQKHKSEFHAWSKQHPRDKYANWNRDSYRRKPDGEPPLWENVTEEILPRVYRFLHPLYCAVEKLGGKIHEDLSMEIRGEHVILKISEGRDQTPHVLTKEEIKQVEKYEQERKKYRYAYEPKFRKYDYIPTGKLRIAGYGDSYIRDTSSAGVETRIGEILLALYLQSEDVRIEREKREEAQRKADEEKRLKELYIQKFNEEVDKLNALTNEARDYEIACQIRAYIAAVEKRPDLDTEKTEWITWAKAKADWFDPTISVVDSVFGKRKHSEDKKDKTPEKKSKYFYW